MKPTLMIHIPRTAGTSMNCVAMQNAPSYQDLSYSINPKCDTSRLWTTTQHISIDSLIERGIITDGWFHDRFKFAFVRNPWDRMVSIWAKLKGYRLRQKRQRMSNLYLRTFDSFVEGLVKCVFVRPLSKLNGEDWSFANQQTEWLKWGIDFVGRYENLEHDWRELCETVGMKYSRLGVEKKSDRDRDYRRYYTK